jgi:ABC-type transporter Mla subunit MlaD
MSIESIVITFLTSTLNMSIGNITVISIAFLLMFWLFWKDLSSYKGNNHQDFKSILVSTGVLGTFIGIFIGLLGFDSNSVADSVPKLLDGLKTAFVTSIVGMGLAILLSIIQKNKSGGGAEDEITALNNISKQLEKLNSIDDKLTSLDDVKKNTEILPLINTKLDSIDTNIKSLSSDISSVKDELKINQKDLFEFLKEKLSEIDNSLKEAVQTLSKGATEEIIKALQNVIEDFNNNLTEQFGDNFKQLNEAVLKMIEWQDTYKNSVQEFEKQLKITAENTNESHQNTTALIREFAETNLKINIITTKNTDTLIKKVGDFSDDINLSLKAATNVTTDNAKLINEITGDYAKIADISDKLKIVIDTNQNQIQNLEEHLKVFAEVSSEAKGITKELKTFSDEVQGSLSNQSQALTKLTEEIEKQLPDSLKTLNKSLTSLTKQFSTDYESFLEQVSKLMKASNIN